MTAVDVGLAPFCDRSMPISSTTTRRNKAKAAAGGTAKRARSDGAKPAGTRLPAEARLAELRRRLFEISDLSSAGAVLGWDQATYMPAGGATARARQGATLSRLAHEKFTDPELGRLLDELQSHAAGLPADSDEACIIRVTRHPFMWGVGVWALLHLCVNGDQASLIFFGTLAVLALGGTVLIDQRRMRENAPGWGVFLQATSNLPFSAILERRQKLVPSEIGLWRVALALGLYVAVFWLHPVLFSVAPLG